MSKPPSRTRKLNPRQQRFAYALALQVIKGDPESPTEAAREAGYKPSPALKATAHKMASDPRVRAIVDPAVEKAAKQLVQEFEVKKGDILRELAHVGFARLEDVMDWGDDGYFVRRPSEIIERGKAALSSVEITEDRIGEDVIRRRTKVKLHPKIEALMAAGRLAGHLQDDKTPTAMAGVQIIVNGGPTGLEVEARRVGPGEAGIACRPSSASKPKKEGLAPASRSRAVVQVGA